MPKAILHTGQIQPVEPLPREWQEGERLRVEKAEDGEPTVDEIDRDFALLAQLCAASDSAEEERLSQALDDARRQSKAQVRRQIGLNECAISSRTATTCDEYLAQRPQMGGP